MTHSDADPATARQARELGTQLNGLVTLRPDEGTDLTVVPVRDGLVEVRASSQPGLPGVRLEVDLADAVGYWQPGHRSAHALPPDWRPPTVTSLVQSAPVGALHNSDGTVLFGWAAGEGIAELVIRYGVSEENKTFVVHVRPVRPLGGELAVLLDGGHDDLATTARRLCGWLSDRCAGSVLPSPEVVRRPVYSTWYTFTQAVDHDSIIAETALATELGCGAVFIDDGWQQLAHGRGYHGCGDWLPDADKFADLADTVKIIHRHGAAAALWIAPLLLGQRSDAFTSLSRFAPHWADSLSCQILDPRHPEVREFVADTCVRLARDYDVDLLKIDFLDQAMVYENSPRDGDLVDVGHAMAAMLDGIRSRLTEAQRSHVAFEFRQPYVSPAIARFGEILRAGDCPADSVTNRMSSLDARLISVGQTVHTDPMMWGRGGGAEAVAQQFYAGWFAVPQISMRLRDLPGEQREAVRGLLALWRDHSDVVLDGTLTVRGAERAYDVVSAVSRDRRRRVVARYSDLVIHLDDTEDTSGYPATVVADHSPVEVTIINATHESRIAVRTNNAISGGVIRSAAAAVVGSVDQYGPGLIDLDVPAFGSITLSIAAEADQLPSLPPLSGSKTGRSTQS